jgi:two-component system chemotaxis response regulator CheY
VDDNGDVRRLNAQVLTGSGYQVHAVENVAVAWDTLQVTSFDLVITDNNMPKVPGIELLRMLRASRIPIPVILATGPMPADELNRHPRLRPTATLLKPYIGEELLETVKQVLCAMEFARQQATYPSDSQEQLSLDGLQT